MKNRGFRYGIPDRKYDRIKKNSCNGFLLIWCLLSSLFVRGKHLVFNAYLRQKHWFFTKGKSVAGKNLFYEEKLFSLRHYTLTLCFFLGTWFIGHSQSSTSAIFHAGTIPSDFAFQFLPGASSCADTLTINIPPGDFVSSIDVSYEMISPSFGFGMLSDQVSWIYCPTTGIGEAAVTNGPPIQSSGTYIYSRTGLTMANGFHPTGELKFEMHAGRKQDLAGVNCDATVAYIVDSTWSITVHHGPAPSCLPPASLLAVNTTATSADIVWAKGSATNSSAIEYGPVGFTPGSGTRLQNVSPPLTLTGLTPGLTYHFYVQDSCSAGNISTRIGPASFATPCDTFIAPYMQDFDLTPDLPDCWASFSSTNKEWAFQAAPSGFGSAPASDHTGSGNYAYVDDFETPANSPDVTLETPLIDVSSLITPALEFFYWSDYNSSPVNLSVDLWDGSTWNTGILTQSAGTSSQWQQYTVDLSVYTITGPIQLRFVVDEDNPFTFSPNHVAIDDIAVKELSPCPPPSNLSVGNITAGSATLSWTTGGDTLWNIEWGLAGFTPGTGTQIKGVNTQPYVLSGLSQSTAYDVYIQDSCIGLGTSNWAGPLNFTTGCSVSVFPWVEDFESGLNCWTLLDENNDGTLWTTDQTGLLSNMGLGAALMDNSFGNSDDYLISPQFPLTGGQQLSFWLRAGTAFDLTELTILASVTGNAPADFTDTLLPTTIVDTNAYRQIVLSLANYSTSTYIAFHLGGGPGILLLDDVVFEALALCPKSAALTASNITTSSAALSWIPGGVASSWNIEWGIAGFPKSFGTQVNNISNPHTLTGLTPNTCYDFYVQDDCGGALGQSIWAGPYTFCTPSSCPLPGSLQVSNITANTADLHWVSAGASLESIVEWGLQGFTPGTGSGNVASGITSTPYSLSGLSPNTCYNFFVKDSCGPGDVSNWAGPYGFCTSSTCPAPDSLEAAVGISHATLSWKPGLASLWNLEWGPAGFTPGTGTKVNTTNNPYTLSALAAGTDYEFYVQDSCGPGDVSSWAGPQLFTTLCTPASQNYLESFGLWPLNCWDVNGGAAPWQDYGTGAAIAPFQMQGNATNFIMTSPPVQLSNDARIRFKWSHTNSPANPNALEVLVSVVGSNTWTSLWSRSGATLESNDGATTSSPGSYKEDTIVLASAYTGQVIQVRFDAKANFFSSNLFIDELQIEANPSGVLCQSPQQLSVSNIDSTSVDLNWSGGSGVSSTVEWGPLGFSPGMGTRLYQLSSSYALSGLEPDSNYCFYVQDSCASGGLSAWFGPYCFRTACPPVPGDSLASPVIVPALPYIDRWTTDCHTDQYSNLSTFTNSADVFYRLRTGPTAISLTASLCGSSFDTYLYVLDSTGNTLQYNDNTCGLQSQITHLPVDANTSYYIVVEGAGTDFGDYELSISEAYCLPPDSLHTLSLSRTSANLSWKAGSPGDRNIQWGPAGFTLGAGIQVQDVSTPYLLMGLDTANCYDFYVQSDCGNVESSWVGPFNFCTEGIGIKENKAIQNLQVYPNPTSGLLQIRFVTPEKEQLDLVVTDILGQKVYGEQLKDIRGSYTHTLDMTDYPKGVYFLQLTAQGTGITQRVYVQ